MKSDRDGCQVDRDAAWSIEQKESDAVQKKRDIETALFLLKPHVRRGDLKRIRDMVKEK